MASKKRLKRILKLMAQEIQFAQAENNQDRLHQNADTIIHNLELRFDALREALRSHQSEMKHQDE